jgi:hypothetical protein
VTGERIGHTEKESSFMLMAMCTMVSGPTIKQMALEPTNTLMGPCMRASGKMICSMGVALRLGPTKVDMRVNMHLDGSMELEATSGAI